MTEPRAISTQQAIDFVNRQARVRVHSAAIGDKSVMAEGVVVAFIPSPCIVLQHEDGSQSTWGITLPIAEIQRTPTYLQGFDEIEGSVSLMCRERNCCEGGKPLAWYGGPLSEKNPYGDIPTAQTIADLARLAAEHDATHAGGTAE